MSDPIKTASSSSVNPFKEGEDKEKSAPKPPPTLDSETGNFVRQLAMDIAKGEFDLPPFPDTALKIQECIRDPNADNQKLAAIVANEPALAARLMRMANSAMLRRGPVEVSDIPTAISRVGMDMVQNVAVSFAARETFQIPPGSVCLGDIEKLRKNSVAVAAIAFVLARYSKSGFKPESAMLSGLLNSVGKFYIFTKANDYPQLFTNRTILDDLINQWHSGVARAIVESWNFPEEVAVAVDEQEVRERDRIGSADLSDVLFIANLLGRAGTSAAEHLGDLDALARLRMNAEELSELLEENEEELQSMIAAMQ